MSQQQIPDETPPTWWEQIAALDATLQTLPSIHDHRPHHSAEIHHTVNIDERHGPVVFVGDNIRICEGVSLSGPLLIKSGVLIGKNAQIRGPSIIHENVLIGYNTEVKRSILERGVSLGPGSYVGDSYLEEDVFFGAHVRTSNYRLDGKNVSVGSKGEVDTGMRKLGCKVGARTSLGIGCKIYPGREVPAGSLFEMDVHIKKNLPAGHYRIKQDLQLLT